MSYEQKFTINEELAPSSDVMFSCVFESKKMFVELINAVTGENETVERMGNPLSQVSYKKITDKKLIKRLNTIRQTAKIGFTALICRGNSENIWSIVYSFTPRGFSRIRIQKAITVGLNR